MNLSKTVTQIIKIVPSEQVVKILDEAFQELDLIQNPPTNLGDTDSKDSLVYRIQQNKAGFDEASTLQGFAHGWGNLRKDYLAKKKKTDILFWLIVSLGVSAILLTILATTLPAIKTSYPALLLSIIVAAFLYSSEIKKMSELEKNFRFIQMILIELELITTFPDSSMKKVLYQKLLNNLSNRESVIHQVINYAPLEKQIIVNQLEGNINDSS